MSTVSERINDYLDNAHDRQVAFLAELVRTPTDNPPGDCAAAAEVAAELLEGLGFAVERHAMPADAVQANGMVSATNLVVRRRFGDGPVVALNAHGDVVPPGDGWTKEPYGAEIHDGRMYGRGVAVSKSDFATYAFALKALEESGAALAGTVELHLTYDEEVGGGIGPQWLLQQGISKPDYAISAGFSYGVVTAHNGCLHLEAEIKGRLSHAALPQNGVDALEAANGVLSALYDARKGYATKKSNVAGIDHPTLVVGLIEGGINTNVVPDRVRLRLDRRLIPEETGGEVEAELGAVIEDAVSRYSGASVDIRRIMLAEPLAPVPGLDRLVEPFVRHGSAIMGETVSTHGVPIYTDARHYALAGVPTILYGAGPRSVEEAGGHGADENLVLDDLRKATEVVALALADLLGDQS
ncbi:MAG: M20/M25/M40 family metallo-hydrolase [Minwuiales bacterium]|nr:M20/M25/M40 family metallo-hydrolase [Minwuiales bacterium]